MAAEAASVAAASSRRKGLSQRDAGGGEAWCQIAAGLNAFACESGRKEAAQCFTGVPGSFPPRQGSAERQRKMAKSLWGGQPVVGPCRGHSRDLVRPLLPPLLPPWLSVEQG